MISYVILISIAIGLSIGVYGWLKLIANPTPQIDCKEGTSLILESENCAPGRLELTLKNNGRFNISGVIISIGNNPQNQPTTYPMPDELGGVLQGHYQFSEPLKPPQLSTASFTNKEKIGNIEQIIPFTDIKVIQLQPFIMDKNQRIICQNAVIKQEITGCVI